MFTLTAYWFKFCFYFEDWLAYHKSFSSETKNICLNHYTPEIASMITHKFYIMWKDTTLKLKTNRNCIICYSYV